MIRRISLLALVFLAACENGSGPEILPPGQDAGVISSEDAGTPYVSPVIKRERSLFWTQTELLDDPSFISFKKVMSIVAPDGHGGRLLDNWFRRFSTTAHSERAQPAQFMDAVAAAQGTDPSTWDLSLLPFKVTGIHNRIDLANLQPGGHCGELRVSFSSTDTTFQPFHMLFLFRQPLTAGDTVNGNVTCEATAQKWAELSRLDGQALFDAVKSEVTARFTSENFLLAETVELTVSPWEWRQWAKVPDPQGQLPFVFDNPLLFQTVDVPGLNATGALRDDFLSFVTANAAALDARTLELPERFRAQSARVTQGVPRTPLDLTGLSSSVTTTYPALRQHIEIIGCPACHTTDADFVQTHTDRTVSHFYDLELAARERHLAELAEGRGKRAPFGPLQTDPKLP
ncbi:MAG: hypothetical protein ACJ790_11505 [Myxococcaceae bacterium]